MIKSSTGTEAERQSEREARRRAAAFLQIDTSPSGIERNMRRISDEVTVAALERKIARERGEAR